MHAHDRFLPEWFNRIRSRQITLPRFQRFVVWGHSEVAGLLTTVLRGLPSGATLILNVGDEEKFISRTMVDAPRSGEKVTEQLLDGQQRLTALWRSLHNTYPDRTYLVGFEEDVINPSKKLPFVYGQARWTKNGKRYPMWVDDPKQCWSRSFIPIHLLRPEDMEEKIDNWVEKAIADKDDKDTVKFQAYKYVKKIINELRIKVREFNLPYLSLPPSTPKEVALDVFIKMNTSSVRLSTYDIVVALVEEETGKSLHDHVEILAEKIPRAAQYADLPELVLDVVALQQNRIPSQAGYRGLDYTKMLDSWDKVLKGIEGMVGFLEEESIFDSQRLPSYTALPIIAALWEHLPLQPDSLGNARHLLRKFFWRACLTSRYEQSSTTNALQDFRGLKKVLCNQADEQNVPILNDASYPLPAKEVIMQAEWPKRKTILGRGLLALQIKCGAEDLADGTRATIASITSKEHPREYHHLFPASILEKAGIPDEQISRALNCALITWRTNRAISDKDPITYLRERASGGALGEEELKRRLRTHLIPYEQLAVGYEGLTNDERYAKIKADYKIFLLARAALLERAAEHACKGETFCIEGLPK
ncbi:MAG: DUF262 domain-containing protein [Clostridia bacterium]|nr:DUF262 domain-containing protein [Clostridia bacterium]